MIHSNENKSFSELDVYQDIIKILNKYNLKEKINLTEDLIEIKDNYVKINTRNSTKAFGKYFEELSINRKNDKGIFFHFMKVKYFRDILESGNIRLYSLSSQTDSLEYTELKNIIKPQKLFLDSGKSEAKDNMFIFCFTKNFRNPKFWESSYGKNEKTGKIEKVVIGFRFKKFKEKVFSKLKHVMYDKENKFNFLKEIQTTLNSKYELYLSFDNIESFVPFFKQEKLQWEDEVRFFYSADLFKFYYKFFVGKNKKEFLIKKDEKKQLYIEIPLKNEFFELEIEEIICGKDIDKKDYQELKEIACDQHIRIWKYN